MFPKLLAGKKRFAFVASEFEALHDRTDDYFRFFLQMLAEIGPHFDSACVVDGRMCAAQAQAAVAQADVVRLSGGDTPAQFGYLEQYGLAPVLRHHCGGVIGMSAGAINLAEAAICTLTCQHRRLEIYPALGCAELSVEPHFDRQNVTGELLCLSQIYTIYGLCDDSMILCADGKAVFYGDVYRLRRGVIEKSEHA